MKTAAELRNEAERIREFALTVTDAEVLGEVLAMAEELESMGQTMRQVFGRNEAPQAASQKVPDNLPMPHMIQPDRVANDLRWEAVAGVGGELGSHLLSLANSSRSG
jgi:hypothetical protein